MLVDGEQILHIVPCLQQHTQDTICLAAGHGDDTLRHLLLYHTGATGYRLLVVEHLEENLRRDVIGIITDNAEAVVVKLREIHP